MNENDMLQGRERVSALLDGQLRGDEVDQALELLAGDAQAREAWDAYHLIGDVLRSPELAGAADASPDFMRRLSQRLAHESIEPAGGAADAAPLAVAVAPAIAAVAPRGEAANEPVLRWRRVAGLASVAAGGALAWWLAGPSASPGAPQLAATPSGASLVVTGSARGPMIRDARLDELLSAHRQVGGAAVLQAPGGFVHNAGFDAPAGGR